MEDSEALGPLKDDGVTLLRVGDPHQEAGGQVGEECAWQVRLRAENSGVRDGQVAQVGRVRADYTEVHTCLHEVKLQSS